MPQKTYLNILKTGIYLSFLSVFLVSGKLLFPYISTKQIYFNVLIEILLFFWIGLIIQYPSFRPKKSWISIGLIGFFVATAISSFTGSDFNLSFWGDVERMLGVFHILHFLAFYFILITVMRKREDWRNFFIASIVIAVFVSLYGLIKNVHYSTIGNTAYVSGYLIFNVFFALILFFNELKKGIKNNLFVWLYPVAIVIMLSVFRITHTRGAYVGLGISAAVMFILYVLLSKNRKIRAYSFSFLAVLIVFVSLVFAYPESRIVKNNTILSTITQISGKAVTFQTRLISWKAAIKDFKNHPVLGVGHGNYAVIFDKHFDPTFYDYTRSETYFDRAHNNIIDILSTTGAVGLLTYLSIFAAIGYYLVGGYRNKKISLNEFVLLTSLMVAYFIQNLAVFDSLVTYIPLMATLGFIYWLSEFNEEEAHERDNSLNNNQLIILFVTILAISTVLYQYNIKPYKMLEGTINGQIAFAQYGVKEGVEEYKKALSHNTVLDRDSRDSLIRGVSSRWPELEKMSREDADEILNFTIEMSNKNLEYNPEDSLMQTMAAQLYVSATQYYKDKDSELYQFYAGEALKAIEKSINASPQRIPLFFMKAQVHTLRGENNKAIETLEYSISLNEKYYESTCTLAKFHFIFEDNEKGFEVMDRCLDAGGVGVLKSVSYVQNLINHYAENEDWPRIIKLYSRLSQLSPNDPKVWVNLASLYAKVGEKEKAIEAANKTLEYDKSMKDEVEEFIRGLESN